MNQSLISTATRSCGAQYLFLDFAIRRQVVLWHLADLWNVLRWHDAVHERRREKYDDYRVAIP